MFEYICDNLFELAFMVIAVVSFVVTFVRTGNIKKSLNNFLGVSDMYKSQKVKYSGQTFSQTVPDYILNSSTNELERKEFDKNVQDKIQSYVDTALCVALDKLLPDKVDERDDVATRYDESLVDLASLADGIETAEHYRELLNLPDNYSVSQIYDAVGKHSKQLRSKLESYNVKESIDEGKKEKA